MKTISRRILLPLILVLLVAALTVGISAQELDLGIPVEERPELFLGRTMPTHGEGKIAVFLIQFPDYKNDKPDATAEYYNQLYFSADPLDENTAGNPWYGSVTTFYREQSMGKLNLSGQVFDWYTAKHERAYYADTWRKMELVMEAVAYYEGKGVDFGQFDGDKNGEIDALIYHFAGPIDHNMEEPWYDGVEFSAHVGETKGGQQINSFIQIDNKIEKDNGNSEQLRRTICHELLHTLGMYDLYGKAWFALCPVEDLMGEDLPFINPYYKILLGWTDKVRLVTSDVSDIQIKLWAETGETVLVTDRYNGIFDEFYMIAYTKYNAYSDCQIRIWHVDARLNADGTAFMNNNLTYVPKPQTDNPHGDGWIGNSPYLFLEEVSAFSEFDNVLNRKPDLYFREGSSLGPDSIPNTDTHDGRYTGIRIDDFRRYETYATMDITFGHKDSSAPKVSDEHSLLGLTAENRLRFSEYVYPSDNWEKIQITTMSGEIISARFVHGYYSAQEIEITIEGDIPRDGYLVVLPAGCVKDSSGNKNEEQTITVGSDGIIFEQSRTLLPWYYKDQERRWESDIFCFSYAGENVTFTTTGEGAQEDLFIEFLKTDADGGILLHKFILNPYPEREVHYIYQANDGSYLILLRDYLDYTYDGLICIDKDGNLRWKKIIDGGLSTDSVAYENKILFYHNQETLFNKIAAVDILDGSMTTSDANGYGGTQLCYNGEDLIGLNIYGEGQLCVTVCDPLTLIPKTQYVIELNEDISFWGNQFVHNSNGTYISVVKGADGKYMALKLSADFQLVKKVVIDVPNQDGRIAPVIFYPDDGFSVAICASYGNHANTVFHIVRMDRNLNLMWETDLYVDYISFFVTKSNRVFAFASYWSPKREAYLLNFGSEDEFEVISHTMTHQPARAATCTAEGQIEHWICADCGGYFSDEEGANAVTAAATVLPKVAHVPQAYADVAPTCINDGSAGGTYCKTCTWELTPKTVIPATGHTPVSDPSVAPTCTAAGVTEGSHCSVCSAVLIPQTVIAAAGHTEVEDAAVAPTAESEGLTAGSHCSVCDAVITPQQPIPQLDAETTEAPETTQAPETPQAPETDSPVTIEPETTEPEQTAGSETMEPEQTDEIEQNRGLPSSAQMIAIAVIAVAALGLLVVIAAILQRWR